MQYDYDVISGQNIKFKLKYSSTKRWGAKKLKVLSQINLLKLYFLFAGTQLPSLSFVFVIMLSLVVWSL